MGCVSSKSLKKQAMADEWNSPLSKSSFSSQDRSFDDYHRHMVALTSTSYGLLKVDSSKPVEDLRKKNRGDADSVNEMYEKIRGFDLAADSGPKPWNEINSMLQILKPGLDHKSTWSPRTERKLGKAGPEAAGAPETIDIGDIMDGLDDDTPRGPSPVKAVSPISKSVFPRRLKPMDYSLSFHTVEELDAHLGGSKAGGGGPAKGFNDPKASVKDPRSSMSSSSGFSGTAEQSGFGKENAKPPGSAGIGPLNATLRENSVTSRKGTVIRSPFVEPQVNTPFKESSGNPKECGESRPISKEIVTTTARLPTSSIKQLTPSKKPNLTLNVDKQNNDRVGAPLQLALSTPPSKGTGAGTPEYFTEPNSPLFDPDLLASYEKALKNLSEDDWYAVRCKDEGVRATLGGGSMQGLEKLGTGSSAANLSPKLLRAKVQTEKKRDPLESFEEYCPPGGEKTLVLYTTTLRGIRKTFEDCNNVRTFVQSFGVSIDERDVSMHLEFRNELRELLGKIVCVPRLFIKGRYIGGAEEVAKIHEDGKLAELLEGLPKEMNGGACDGCGGVRFVPCLECSGSCKIVNEYSKVVRCPDCNENGLIQCPICS